MQINPLSQVAQYLQAAPKSRPGGSPAAKEAARDTVEISSPAPEADPMAKKLALASIRTKIAAGFYNSNEVIDDLSEKLSRVLKETV